MTDKHAIYALTAYDQKDLQMIDCGNRNPGLHMTLGSI